MADAIFCIADTEARAARIVGELREAGFTDQAISILCSHATGARAAASDAHAATPEGASTGLGTGALLGGTLGWLSGVGAIAVPGLGALVAAGPILATLGAAAVGGLSGALVGYAVPELEAKLYESKLEAGNYLLSVHTTSVAQQTRARDIFTRNQATHISGADRVAELCP